jgi:D-inositol-3-phosphate glycosyltransferase
MRNRIALISEHASPLGILGGVDSGGQNVYVGQLARHLSVIGYSVDVFTRRDNPDLPEVVDWADAVRIVHVTAGPAAPLRKEDLLPHMAEFTASMLAFFAREALSYDLIHANFWMSALVAADIKRATGIPFVVTFHALGRVRRLHQGQADGFPDERFAVEDRVIAEADHVIAECPQDEEDLIRLYNADPARITIVPSGFDPAEFWPIEKSRARRKLGLPADARIILQLGRMVPRKGVETVVRALGHLQREHALNIRLVIVGGESSDPDPRLTPEIGRLQAIAEAEGVAGLVTFAGSRSRDELKYYYSAADIFVTTPWYEPFGITPLESMACGTPVVGSNVGGVKFTVRDGETGYLVPAKDPAALAERIADLYQNPRLLGVLSRQAVRRANDLFTWQRIAGAMSALYEAVLAARQPERRAEADQLALIDRGFHQASEVFHESRLLVRTSILEAAQAIVACFERGNKVLVCGNGGSAADAQHFAGELIGRFKYPDRPGLPVLALTADSAVVTAWANDVGYEKVFARQVEALGQPGDLLLGISTSGRSRNVLEAFDAARRNGLGCIALAGGDGGDMLELADTAIVVPSPDTPRVQEVQILALHLICELIDEEVMAGRLLPPGGARLPRPAWDLHHVRQTTTQL